MADKEPNAPPKGSPSSGWNPNRYVGMLEEALEFYERDHPHWQIEVLVSFIRWGLSSLKFYVEDKTDSEVNWNNPFVELHYEVNWDWERATGSRSDADQVHSGMLFGKFTPENTTTRDSTLKTLTDIMVSRMNTLALGALTNGAWFEIQNQYYTPVLPVELSQQLNAIKGKRARSEAFQEFVRPFSIGAASIDYTGMNLEDGARVSKRVARQLARIQERIDIQSILFSERINGRDIKMSVIFQVHPLIADYDQKKAYHPITCGLFIEPRIIEGEIVESTPAEWPREDRESLWNRLLNQIEHLTSQLIPQPEIQSSKILAINAELEIPMLSDEQMNEAKAKVVALLSQAPGLLRNVSVRFQDSPQYCDADTRSALKETVEDLIGEVPVIGKAAQNLVKRKGGIKGKTAAITLILVVGVCFLLAMFWRRDKAPLGAVHILYEGRPVPGDLVVSFTSTPLNLLGGFALTNSGARRTSPLKVRVAFNGTNFVTPNDWRDRGNFEGFLLNLTSEELALTPGDALPMRPLYVNVGPTYFKTNVQCKIVVSHDDGRTVTPFQIRPAEGFHE